MANAQQLAATASSQLDQITTSHDQAKQQVEAAASATPEAQGRVNTALSALTAVLAADTQAQGNLAIAREAAKKDGGPTEPTSSAVEQAAQHAAEASAKLQPAMNPVDQAKTRQTEAFEVEDGARQAGEAVVNLRQDLEAARVSVEAAGKKGADAREALARQEQELPALPGLVEQLTAAVQAADQQAAADQASTAQAQAALDAAQTQLQELETRYADTLQTYRKARNMVTQGTEGNEPT